MPWWSQLSPFIEMWVLGLELKVSGLAASAPTSYVFTRSSLLP